MWLAILFQHQFLICSATVLSHANVSYPGHLEIKWNWSGVRGGGKDLTLRNMYEQSRMNDTSEKINSCKVLMGLDLIRTGWAQRQTHCRCPSGFGPPGPIWTRGSKSATGYGPEGPNPRGGSKADQTKPYWHRQDWDQKRLHRMLIHTHWSYQLTTYQPPLPTTYWQIEYCSLLPTDRSYVARLQESACIIDASNACCIATTWL